MFLFLSSFRLQKNLAAQWELISEVTFGPVQIICPNEPGKLARDLRSEAGGSRSTGETRGGVWGTSKRKKSSRIRAKGTRASGPSTQAGMISVQKRSDAIVGCDHLLCIRLSSENAKLRSMTCLVAFCCVQKNLLAFVTTCLALRVLRALTFPAVCCWYTGILYLLAVLRIL